MTERAVTETGISNLPEVREGLSNFGEIAGFVEAVEKSRQEGKGNIDIAYQLQNKIDVLSASLFFGDSDDVREFGHLRHGILEFGCNLGEDEAILSSQELVGQVENWIDAGVRADSISAWFDSVGGFFYLDPVLISNLLSERVGEQSAEHLSDVVDDRMMIDNEDCSELVRSALHNLGSFASEVANRLSKKTTSVDSGGVDGLVQVEQSARKLSRIIAVIENDCFESVALNRPATFNNVRVPAAIALSEVYSEMEPGDFELGREDTARSLVRMIRRRRVLLDRENVLGFCTDFKVKDCAGSEMMASFLTDESRDQVLNEVGNQLIPEFVFQLRSHGLHTFEWSERDYHELGFPEELWSEHNQRLASIPEDTSGPEVVRKGDFVIDYSGQHQPTHAGHEGLINEIAERDREILLRLMRRGGTDVHHVWVGLRVNFNNEIKAATQLSEDTRRMFLRKSARGVDCILTYPPGEDLSNGERIRLYDERFREADSALSGHALLLGSDKAHLESGEIDTLDASPKIFALRLNGFDNFLLLESEISAILEKYPKSVVMLTPFCELESSRIVREIDLIDKAALTTLVHPQIAEDVLMTLGTKTE